MKFQAYPSDLFQEPVLRTKYVWCKVNWYLHEFLLNDTSYNTRSFVLLIRYIPSLFMVTEDLSNPTIKTQTAYLIKNFQPRPWQLDACFELDATQLCKILFYQYLTGLVNLTHVVFVLFLFELKIINSRSQLDLVGIVKRLSF